MLWAWGFRPMLSVWAWSLQPVLLIWAWACSQPGLGSVCSSGRRLIAALLAPAAPGPIDTAMLGTLCQDTG